MLGNIMKTKEIKYNVKGRVQGVGFRFYTQKKAIDTGISGYVKNLPDGSVEVVASGSDSQLAEFKKHLETGPSMALVQSIEQQKQPVSKKRYRGFKIKY